MLALDRVKWLRAPALWVLDRQGDRIFDHYAGALNHLTRQDSYAAVQQTHRARSMHTGPPREEHAPP